MKPSKFLIAGILIGVAASHSVISAATTCLDESGKRTCCDAWIVDTWEGGDKGAISSRTIDALQARIKESISINRIWCRNVPQSKSCNYRVGTPRCDASVPQQAGYELTPEEQRHLIEGTRLLLREWEIRLQEAISAQRGANPYLGVGRAAQSYVEALSDAQKKLRAAKALLEQVYEGAGGGVIRRLDTARKELDSALTRVKTTKRVAEEARQQEMTEAGKSNKAVIQPTTQEQIQRVPGVTAFESHRTGESPKCPDLSYCLSVQDAVWDTRDGTMTVTLMNSCPSSVRVLLSAPYFDQRSKIQYLLEPSESTPHSVRADRNSWVAVASQSNATDVCLAGLN